MQEIAPGVFKVELDDIMGKPRMTQRDKFIKRPIAQRYWAFKDELRIRGVKIPECGYHLIAVIPMPHSWTGKKKADMNGRPHQQTPDKDNVEKGILDALYQNDASVWDGRVTKFWGEKPCLYIKLIEFYPTLEDALGCRP